MRIGFGLGLKGSVAASAAPPTIASLHGTGLGQVPVRFRFEDATASGGMVATAANIGGAGAAHDAMGASANNQAGPSTTQLTARGFVNTGTQGGLLMAAPLDLLGKRLFMVLELDAEPASSNLAGRSVGTGDGQRTNTVWATATHRLQAERWDGTVLVPEIATRGSPIGVGGWHLVEAEVTTALGVRFFVDGTEYPGDGAITWADFTVQRLMWGHLAQPLIGTVRDILFLNVDGGQASQIALIRQALAAERGLTVAA